MTDGRGLFGSVLWRGGAFEATTDAAWLQAMLDAESALARAAADVGLMSHAAAEAIARCCRSEALGPEAIEDIGLGAAAGGNPVIPLVRRLVSAVNALHRGGPRVNGDGDCAGGEGGVVGDDDRAGGEDGVGAAGVGGGVGGAPARAVAPGGAGAAGAGDGSGAGDAVHRGATSQDIIDTAAMLVSRNAVAAINSDLNETMARCAALTSQHRSTVMVGRTLGQHAELITFGFKAAGWLSGLGAARRQLAALHDNGAADAVFVAQLGGPVGTLSMYGEHGPGLLEAFARRLGLAAPAMAWHTERSRIGRLAGALGVTAGVVAKIATDLVLLAQSEVAEVSDAVEGRGGSSSMPHKRNPVAAISACAAAQTVPGSVATLLAAMAHEHERAAGAWHAEWSPMVAALRATGSAVAWLRDALDHLEVDGDAMAARARATADLLEAPVLAAALTPALGAVAAHDRIRAAALGASARNIPLRMVLAEDATVAMLVASASGDPAAVTSPAIAIAGDHFISRVLVREGYGDR